MMSYTKHAICDVIDCDMDHKHIKHCDIITFMISYALQHIYDQCIIVDRRLYSL